MLKGLFVVNSLLVQTLSGSDLADWGGSCAFLSAYLWLYACVLADLPLRDIAHQPGSHFLTFSRMPSSADWLTFGSQCTARLGSFRTCLRFIIEPRSHLPPAHPGQFSNKLARPYSLWGSSGLQAHRPTIFHGIQGGTHSSLPFLSSSFLPSLKLPYILRSDFAERCL